jgi:hypothetical protein
MAVNRKHLKRFGAVFILCVILTLLTTHGAIKSYFSLSVTAPLYFKHCTPLSNAVFSLKMGNIDTAIQAIDKNAMDIYTKAMDETPTLNKVNH